MVDKFDVFIRQLLHWVSLEQKTIEEIKALSRPKEQEDVRSHKRSGKVGAYKEKLKPETIQKINIFLKKTLIDFNY